MRTVFLSFANKDWRKGTNPIDRIGREAEAFAIFDKIALMNEDSFDEWYVEKYRSRFSERGYGYWQWKSYIIQRTLEELEESDVLFYCDAGCHLNLRGKKRMLEYIEIVSNSPSGVLLFEQGLKENNWTKGDIFEFLNLNPLTYSRNQCWGGALFLRKCANSCGLVNDWFEICHNFHHLISDEPSQSPSYEGFIENRHDQSVLSLLVHSKYPCDFILADETYADNDWNSLWKYPIWACRNHVKEVKREAMRNHYNPVRIIRALISNIRKKN